MQEPACTIQDWRLKLSQQTMQDKHYEAVAADGMSTVDLDVRSACTLTVVKELVDTASMSFQCTIFQVHVNHLQLHKCYKCSQSGMH